jgi:hypothetical protein
MSLGGALGRGVDFLERQLDEFPRLPVRQWLYDKSDRVPYDSGEILCDDDKHAFIDAVASRLAQFIEAIQKGERSSWILSQPHLGQFPESVNDTDQEIVEWVVTTMLDDYTRVVDQCPGCGRLLVQEAPYHHLYYPFKPEKQWQGLLSDVGLNQGVEQSAKPPNQSLQGTRKQPVL